MKIVSPEGLCHWHDQPQPLADNLSVCTRVGKSCVHASWYQILTVCVCAPREAATSSKLITFEPPNRALPYHRNLLWLPSRPMTTIQVHDRCSSVMAVVTITYYYVGRWWYRANYGRLVDKHQRKSMVTMTDKELYGTCLFWQFWHGFCWRKKFPDTGSFFKAPWDAVA